MRSLLLFIIYCFSSFLICCSTVISCPLSSHQTSPLSALPSSKCSSYPQHGQDTQMVKRPSSCKGTGVTRRLGKQKVEERPLLWSECDSGCMAVLCSLMVLLVPLHSSKAQTQPRISAPHWEEKTFCTAS